MFYDPQRVFQPARRDVGGAIKRLLDLPFRSGVSLSDRLACCVADSGEVEAEGMFSVRRSSRKAQCGDHQPD